MTLNWNKLRRRINTFKEKESFLLKNNINERAITHKLAEHLQKLFPEYNVDCEYNKMPTDDATGFIKKRLDLSIDDIKSDNSDGTTVFPDIIVHKRGYNTDNLLIIEVKKKTYADKKTGITSEETYRDFDIRKIKAYMEKLEYKNGLYIEFNLEEISNFLEFPTTTYDASEVNSF